MNKDEGHQTPATVGLDWDGSDFIEVVAQSALCLRTAMSYAHDACEVKKWVDAKLLEMLWCPCGHPENPDWLSKDVVRSKLSSLPPKKLWHHCCDWSHESKCPKLDASKDVDSTMHCYAGGLLARVLLGPMDWFFECERKPSKDTRELGDSPLLWVVAKLYDQLGDINFYRTLSGMELDDPDYQIGQLLFRIPEADYEWFRTWIADFSTLLREKEDKKEVDYCLICTEAHAQSADEPERFPPQFLKYDVSGIMSALDTSALRRKLNIIRKSQIREILSQRILTEKTRRNREEALNRKRLGASDIPTLLESDEFALALNGQVVTEAINEIKGKFEKCFYAVPGSKNGKSLPDDLREKIASLVDEVNQKSLVTLAEDDKSLHPKLANYFIWLKALHPKLGSYTVRYSANYRLLPDSDSATEGRRDRIQNPCFVIASRELPSPRLLAAARVSLTHCLGPLEDYYAIWQARKNSAVIARADVGTGMFHNLRHYVGALQNDAATLARLSEWMSTESANEATPKYVADTAVALKRTLQKLDGFQRAVFHSLVTALIEQQGLGLVNHVSSFTNPAENTTIRRGAEDRTIAADQAIADALRLFYRSVKPSLERFGTTGSDDWVEVRERNVVRSIVGCSWPIGSIESFTLADESELKRLSKEKWNSLGSILPEDIVTLEEAIAALGKLGIDIRTRDVAGCLLPQDAASLVLEEVIINAVRAAAKYHWFTGGGMIVSIVGEHDTIMVSNTAIPEDIQRLLRPPEHPQGREGWGRYAVHLMLKLRNWQVKFSEGKLDEFPVAITSLSWGQARRQGDKDENPQGTHS